MEVSDISNEDFAHLQRRLTEAGYLKKGFISKGANWQFDFRGGRESTLLGLKKFLRDVGADLSEKDLMLLAFMLDHTNKNGECSGSDEEDVA